jgi:hypothetical protein
VFFLSLSPSSASHVTPTLSMARGKNKLSRRDRERRAPKAGTTKASDLAEESTAAATTCAHPALTHQAEARLSALLKKVFIASFNVSVPKCHALLLHVAQDGLVSDACSGELAFSAVLTSV